MFWLFGMVSHFKPVQHCYCAIVNVDVSADYQIKAFDIRFHTFATVTEIVIYETFQCDILQS